MDGHSKPETLLVQVCRRVLKNTAAAAPPAKRFFSPLSLNHECPAPVKLSGGLTGRNVHLNIYHRVQSKSLHKGREEAGQDGGCLYLSGFAGGPRGLRSALFLSSISYNILAAAPSGRREEGGGEASLPDRPQMKSEKQVDVTNEAR